MKKTTVRSACKETNGVEYPGEKCIFNLSLTLFSLSAIYNPDTSDVYERFHY